MLETTDCSGSSSHCMQALVAPYLPSTHPAQRCQHHQFGLKAITRVSVSDWSSDNLPVHVIDAAVHPTPLNCVVAGDWILDAKALGR